MSFFVKRSCANCGAEWVRWRYCRECWHMVAKTLAAAVASELAARLLHRLF